MSAGRCPSPFALIVVLAQFAGLGCKDEPPAPAAKPRTVMVFAAASLTEAFRDLGKDFQASNPGATVSFNFAGSQQLKEQLAQGAPADLFASASTKEMDAALGASLVAADSVKQFARNKLVVIYPRKGQRRIAELADLAKARVKLDVADPAVPVGRYTMRMFERMSSDAAFGPDFKAKVLANVVSREDNVKSVVSKVRLGEADAGVVYLTDVTPDAAKDVVALPVPDAYNQTAEYPIAVAAVSKQPELARKFEDFVLSAPGQQVLQRYGFLPAAENP